MRITLSLRPDQAALILDSLTKTVTSEHAMFSVVVEINRHITDQLMQARTAAVTPAAPSVNTAHVDASEFGQAHQ